MMAAMTTSTPGTLQELARAHMPAQDAERWIGLLKPGARLRRAREGERVVGVLGGEPRLPEGVEWPVWEGRGPLGFVAAVDCGAIRETAAGQGMDLPLRTDGWLAFFYYEDDEALEIVDAGDPRTWAGYRVLHLPAGYEELPRRATPEGAASYDEVPLTAEIGLTAPAGDAVAVARALGFREPTDEYAHPVGSDAFVEEVRRLAPSTHQLLGNADNVQGPVETEVARGVLGGVDWSDPRLEEEAQRWTLLAQFDSDEEAGMCWGDCGVLYWLIRPEDLAANRFEEARFTWQCC